MARALYVQLADCLEDEILRGMYSPGARLPTTRELAVRFSTTPVTVGRALRELRDRHRIVSRVGSGSYVLHGAEPACGAFPREDLREIFRCILDEDAAAAFAYEPSEGYAPLVEALRVRMTREGMDIANDRILPCSGTQQALNLAFDVLLREGDWVLVSSPTYPGALRLLAQRGVRIESMPIGATGPNQRELRRIFASRPLRMVYATPVYHNPTGRCWPAEIADELRRLCDEHGVYLVEDDPCSDLSFGASVPRPIRMRCGASPYHLYIHSFSRSFLPGARLGVCVVPHLLHAPLSEAKRDQDLCTSGFFQRVFHRFLESGAHEDRIQRMNQLNESLFPQCMALATAFANETGVDIVQPDGGFSLWCAPPPGSDVSSFFLETARQALPVLDGAKYEAVPTHGGSFVLSFPTLDPDEWKRVLDELAAILA
ncbi:MAG: PLP-dependent aminotransferase family protein [Lentisphaeria bacterium]|nr:PLP-dependent aminotransferase family protein [Lentisphaeria bacterium]